jgi:hypothetical protein
MPIIANAMALARSAGANSTGITASETGVRTAAPIPISARIAMSWPASLVSAAAPEASPKSTSPISIRRLRPYRSASAPAGSSRPAKTSTYASTIHWSWLLVAWMSAASVGSATLRMVASNPMVRTASMIAARAHQRCFMTVTTFRKSL